MRQPKVITGRQAYLYSKIGCEHPIFVKTMSGRTIPVPCGRCCACLSRRRQAWAKRLVDESLDERCIHAFGITLTYDSKHVPWLTQRKLKYIKEHEYDFEKIRCFYEFPNKTHSYLKVERGCSPKRLATTEYVGVVCSRDIDAYIKEVRNELNEKINHIKSHQKEAKADLFLRYFIHGDYGEIDEEKGERGRTGRPHYHGIMFLCATTKEIAETIKTNINILNNVQLSIENIALHCWHHCTRFWSNSKQRWCGKSIETFGKNWGDYLGRYINKEENSAFCGCLGEKYVPARIWCSRMNAKYDYGSIGTSFVNNLLYAQYMSELKRCQDTGEVFNPSYKEDGYTKALPRAYVRMLLQDYFGFRFSRLAKFIRLSEVIKRYPLAFRMEHVMLDTIDPNDPFEILHEYGPRLFYHPMKIRKQPRKRFSLATFPPPREEEYECPTFIYSDIEAMEAYLAFHKQQVDAYIDGQTDGITDIREHNVRLEKGELMALLHPSYQTDPHFLALVRKERKKQETRCADIRNKALERKHRHEIANGYTAC